MIEELRLAGLGVIEEAVLELGPGLTVLTGETGAGKTMVLTGLGLLFGGRADPGLVRAGSARAEVEGRLRVDPAGPVARRVAEAGGDLDGDGLLLARIVTAEGRSRAYVGGRAAPAGVLADLAEDLVAVHGQADQRQLLRAARQREVLDRFAGAAVQDRSARYGRAYRQLRAVTAELAEVAGRARERAQEADLLRFGLDEIAAVDPRAGEDAELTAEAARLGHADALRAAADGAHQALLGDPAQGAADALGLVAAARRELDRVRDHDPALAALADRLAEVGYLLADVATDLASYAAGLETDPARLAAVEERRAALARLTRKYGATAADVLAWAGQAATRLALLDDDSDRVERLRADQDRLRGELAGLAAELTAARRAAGERFAAAVATELAGLAMPQARVSVALHRRPDPDGLLLPGATAGTAFGPTGVDEVELLLAAHSGAPPRPLHRGASGGELSRVMLAVEVVFAGADPVPTFVFDEVDAGVGGRAAVEVGARLARLAARAQVLVVTHLPQVAAYADRHLVVTKAEGGWVTRSGVVQVEGAARVRELSRMLAGLADSALAQGHAEELLAAAAQQKAGRLRAGPDTPGAQVPGEPAPTWHDDRDEAALAAPQPAARPARRPRPGPARPADEEPGAPAASR